MQFGEISEKVGGEERKGEDRSGGGGPSQEGNPDEIQFTKWMISEQMGVLIVKKRLLAEAEASCVPMFVWRCCEIDSP